jgi:hypothetical protein
MTPMKTTKTSLLRQNLGVLLFIIIFCTNFVLAQGKHLSRHLVDLSFKAAVYLENTFPKYGLNTGQSDTLSGSGFLLADNHI